MGGWRLTKRRDLADGDRLSLVTQRESTQLLERREELETQRGFGSDDGRDDVALLGKGGLSLRGLASLFVESRQKILER
mgnify:CR=1 FL=1